MKEGFTIPDDSSRLVILQGYATLAGPSTKSLPAVKEPLSLLGSGCWDHPDPNKQCL